MSDAMSEMRKADREWEREIERFNNQLKKDKTLSDEYDKLNNDLSELRLNYNKTKKELSDKLEQVTNKIKFL